MLVVRLLIPMAFQPPHVEKSYREPQRAHPPHLRDVRERGHVKADVRGNAANVQRCNQELPTHCRSLNTLARINRSSLTYSELMKQFFGTEKGFYGISLC